VTRKSSRWFKVRDCLWSKEGELLRKPCLESFYPDLSEFFVDFLGVPRLSLTLAYQQLLEVGDSTPTIPQVKNLLWSLNALLPSESGEKPVFGDAASSCRIFPVRMPDGNLKPLSARDEFVIADRQHFADAFRDMAKVLDFSLEEVRRLKPLIDWTGIAGRYLSLEVVERTVVEDTQCVLDKQLTRDLSYKAGAFAR
jgi:hypothetical protein